MDNIFEGAKFGDKFLCKDGVIAVFLSMKLEACHNRVYLIRDGELYITEYDIDGKGIYAVCQDIVSKYQEPNIIECYECRSTFEYSDKDIIDEVWVICPKCGEKICILE